MKRIIFFSYFIFISFFCFAQQNLPARIIGGIPAANSNKKYQIQVGAYKIVKNAEDAVFLLKNINLQPATEKFRDFTRVLVKDVPANQVRSILSSIAKAGFTEVIIREDSSYKDAPPKRQENIREDSSSKNAPSVSQENNYRPPIQEDNFESPDSLCKTWIIDDCPNPELVGFWLFILDDGTFFIANIKGESSSLSEWRWSDDGKYFEYSHNDWEYYGRAEIISHTEDFLEIMDSGYKYDTPGHTPADYSNHWVFSSLP